MIKSLSPVVLAFLVLSGTANAAAPASCTDANGHPIPPARCVTGAAPAGKQATASERVPNFPARKAMMLKNMRQAAATLQAVIACTERSTTDAGMRVCASK